MPARKKPKARRANNCATGLGAPSVAQTISREANLVPPVGHEKPDVVYPSRAKVKSLPRNPSETGCPEETKAPPPASPGVAHHQESHDDGAGCEKTTQARDPAMPWVVRLPAMSRSDTSRRRRWLSVSSQDQRRGVTANFGKAVEMQNPCTADRPCRGYSFTLAEPRKRASYR